MKYPKNRTARFAHQNHSFYCTYFTTAGHMGFWSSSVYFRYSFHITTISCTLFQTLPCVLFFLFVSCSIVTCMWPCRRCSCYWLTINLLESVWTTSLFKVRTLCNKLWNATPWGKVQEHACLQYTCTHKAPFIDGSGHITRSNPSMEPG